MQPEALWQTIGLFDLVAELEQRSGRSCSWGEFPVQMEFRSPAG
jgi:hypothetical protein